MRIIGNDPSTPRQAQIVASGTLPSGQPVVVNADGTVSVVSETSTDFTESLGSPSVSQTVWADGTSSTFDSVNNKVIVAYLDQTNGGGKIAVGTVSGTSVSFGTGVSFASSANYLSVSFDDAAGKVVISYMDGNNSSYGTAKVGTVSGSTISFGTALVFSSFNTGSIKSVYDSNAGKTAIFYSNAVSGGGYASIATVSGTDITVGSQNNIGVHPGLSPTFDSVNNKVVIAYADVSTNYGSAKVGTISGTSISFGSGAVYESNAVEEIAAGFDANSGKVVVAYLDRGGADDGAAAVGTVSGTSISFGTPVDFTQDRISYTSIVFDSAANRMVISYRNSSTNDNTYLVSGAVSGTSITFDTPLIVETGTVTSVSSAFDSNSNVTVVSYRDWGNSNYLTSAVFRNAYTQVDTNLTSENYIGMSGGVVNKIAALPQAIGDPVVFESATSDFISATFDSNSNKVVIAYTDDDNLGYGTAVVGTVNGTAISFGSPVVFESGYATETSCVFDSSSNKIVIAYRDNDNSSYGTAVVGTVSGTSISFGTPVVFESANSTEFEATFDSNSNKVVIAYKDLGNSSYGTAIVGTVSGTSISFGSAAVFESATTSDIDIAFDSSSNKVVIGYQDGGNSQYGTAIVGTVSGTSISFGSAAVFESAEVSSTSLTFDSANNKVVIAYRDHGNSNYGTAIVGTVSGTSISFGSAAVFESATTVQISAAYDSSSNKVVVAYVDNGNSNHGTVAVGTVSGTSISFGSPVVFESASTSYVGSTFDDNSNRVVIAYKDVGNSNYGTSVVFQNAGDYLVSGSVADGDNAAINLKGAVDENQVGLTAGQSYYVQTDGTLGTTPADPSVFAGTAVAATKLIVKG